MRTSGYLGRKERHGKVGQRGGQAQDDLRMLGSYDLYFLKAIQMLSSKILMSVFRRHDKYYHNYEGGIEMERFYLYPFAHKSTSNTLLKIPFSDKYFFISELFVLALICASIFSCVWVGIDLRSWWPVLLLNITSLGALGTRGLMNYVLLINDAPLSGVVISVNEYENAGGERKELCIVRSPDGTKFEMSDLVPGAYSIGDKVLLLSSNEGSGISIHKGQAMVEIGMYCLLYVGSCWLIVCELA